MDTAMRTLQVTLPVADVAFLRHQSRGMGWQITTVRKPRTSHPKNYDVLQTTGFKEAMDDVKNGRVTHYASTEELFKELGIAL